MESASWTPRPCSNELLGDSDSSGVRAAFDELRRSGTPFHRLAPGADGCSYAVIGEPAGGLLRILLRQADQPGSGDTTAVQPQSAAGPATGAAGHDLEVLLDRAPMITWLRDADGRIVWCRGRIATRHGTVDCAAVAQALRLTPRPAAEKRPAAGPDAEPPAAVAADPVPRRFRMEIPGGAQGARIVLDAAETDASDGGSIGFAVDAAPLLEAEQTLSRFVRTMTETFAHLTVGLAIFDRNQTLVMFNPALVQMWQADPAWLARRPSLREIIDRLRANRRIPEAADFHGWRRKLTGLFEDTEAADYEELWHLSDGSDIRVLARPHPHGSLAFVFDDITERLRLEQQFRHSIDLRRATLNRLDEGLAVFGHDGLLQIVNAAFHEIWGTDAASIRPAMHARELMPLVAGLTVETDVWRRMLTFVTSDETREPWDARLTLGSGRILRARFAPLPDGSTLAAFSDITDSERFARALHERNEVLEAAEEMRSAVLDQISHRLRTPLNTIFGFSQLIADRSFGALSDSQRGYAEGIIEAARQLLASVDEVSDLAALEIDRAYDEDGGPALADTLMLTGQLLERRAAEAGINLRIGTPGAECDPASEPGRLRQIAFGLAADAIGRCPAGGSVELGARPLDPALVEIFAIVRPVDGGQPSQLSPTADPPTHGFLRRLAEQEGGSFVFSVAGAAGPEIAVRLPNRAAEQAEIWEAADVDRPRDGADGVTSEDCGLAEPEGVAGGDQGPGGKLAS